MMFKKVMELTGAGRYLMYGWYVLRHKWYVFTGCAHFALKYGKPRMLWYGVVHDGDKLGRHSFVVYARHFYNRDGSQVPKTRNPDGYYSADDPKLDPEFKQAVNLHIHMNEHHWEYWAIRGKPHVVGCEMTDKGVEVHVQLEPLAMPYDRVLEMIADWNGAGRAQGTGNTLSWYTKHRADMQLHPATRSLVDYLVGYMDPLKGPSMQDYWDWLKKTPEGK